MLEGVCVCVCMYMCARAHVEWFISLPAEMRCSSNGTQVSQFSVHVDVLVLVPL